MTHEGALIGFDVIAAAVSEVPDFVLQRVVASADRRLTVEKRPERLELSGRCLQSHTTNRVGVKSLRSQPT
jgi:hypothetical protein